jgi:hypothetical protein
MKKSVFFMRTYLLLLIVVTSCKKISIDAPPIDLTQTVYYVKFKANGAAVEYRGLAAGNFNVATSAPVSYISSIAGAKNENDNKKDVLALLLETAQNTKLNTNYTNFTPVNTNALKAPLCIISMYDEVGEFYMSWDESTLPIIPQGTITNNIMVVTSFATGAISGKFSGTLYNQNFTKKKVITDGEFYVKAL